MNYSDIIISPNRIIPPWRQSVMVETALLGQGLPSVENNQISGLWPLSDRVNLVWLEHGRIITGGIADFLEVRNKKGMVRVDGYHLDRAAAELKSGFLTASAVMRVAAGIGAAVVTTAGMGGVRDGIVSDDLKCLVTHKVLLIATSPKDTQNISSTVEYLRKNGVKVIGKSTGICCGFLFSGQPVVLDGEYRGESVKDLMAGHGVLLLYPLETESLINNRELLIRAMAEGEKAKMTGGDYHPAVNAALDRVSRGKLSLLQLHALVKNIEAALDVILLQ